MKTDDINKLNFLPNEAKINMHYGFDQSSNK